MPCVSTEFVGEFLERLDFDVELRIRVGERLFGHPASLPHAEPQKNITIYIQLKICNSSDWFTKLNTTY